MYEFITVFIAVYIAMKLQEQKEKRRHEAYLQSIRNLGWDKRDEYKHLFQSDD